MSYSDKKGNQPDRRNFNDKQDRTFQKERGQMDGSMKPLEEKRLVNEMSEPMKPKTTTEVRTRIGRKQLKMSGKQVEQQKENGTREEAVQKKRKKMRIRLIPIWLRILIVLVLLIVFFFIGAMIGYGIIGDGNPFDVFKTSTWTHIFDIVNKGT